MGGGSCILFFLKMELKIKILNRKKVFKYQKELQDQICGFYLEKWPSSIHFNSNVQFLEKNEVNVPAHHDLGKKSDTRVAITLVRV